MGTATAGILGAELDELVYAVLEGMKRGVVLAQAGRLLLERVLPTSRPLPVELPVELPVVEDATTMREAVRIAARANGEQLAWHLQRNQMRGSDRTAP